MSIKSFFTHLFFIAAVAMLVSIMTGTYAHVKDDVTIAVTDEGFFPDYVKIDAGTKITWINNVDSLHWPASDLHPTHTVYPVSDITKCNTEEKGKIFDACRGLRGGEKYTFTFDKVGTWGVHDHLYPGNTMTVEVTGDDNGLFYRIKSFFSSLTGFFSRTQKQFPSHDEFRALDYYEQQELLGELSRKDPGKAWKYLKDAFTSNGQIKENPHELAHMVGNAIYAKGGIDGITICDPAFAFGCYHGVTEKMLLDIGVNGVSQVERRCLEIFANQHAPATSCIHGTGHGLATWEGLDIKKALEDCDVLGSEYRIYCYDGVFMEYSFSGFVSGTDNPWQFCLDFDEKYHPLCAKYQVYTVGKVFDWNFSQMAQSCNGIQLESLTEYCFSSLGFVAANIAHGSHEEIIDICSLTNEGKNSCIITAAIEAIFQEYSGWWESSAKLCESLDGEWKSVCTQRTTEIIEGYNRLVPDIHPPEIRQIKALDNLDEQVILYRKLISRVGVEEAQEYLYRSGMPFTGQTHLLNHVSGDYIYEEYGAEGLVKCRDYFLASCYHGFILHAIGDGGLDAVDETIEECKKFGITVVSQCSHALGHGFLAWVGYDRLTNALDMCDKTAKRVDDFPSFNCRDGVFMENIWGIHSGEPSPDRWVDENDNFYPCNDPRINPSHLDGCWSNQPSLMYQMFEGNLTKIGEECLKVENSSHKRTCFNALARQIHPLTNGGLDATLQLCNLLPTQWINYCLNTVALSDFSVGGRDLSFKICSSTDEDGKSECYNGLYGVMLVYSNSRSQYEGWCENILEEEWREGCMSYGLRQN